jgi:hypothetical protein
MWSTTALEICANFLDYVRKLRLTKYLRNQSEGVSRQLPHKQNLGNNRDKKVVLSGSVETIFESAVTTTVPGMLGKFRSLSTRPWKILSILPPSYCALPEFSLVRTEHRNFSHAALEVI